MVPADPLTPQTFGFSFSFLEVGHLLSFGLRHGAGLVPLDGEFGALGLQIRSPIGRVSRCRIDDRHRLVVLDGVAETRVEGLAMIVDGVASGERKGCGRQAYKCND